MHSSSRFLHLEHGRKSLHFVFACLQRSQAFVDRRLKATRRARWIDLEVTLIISPRVSTKKFLVFFFFVALGEKKAICELIGATRKMSAKKQDLM